MNWIDIITVVFMVWAVYNGWRRGVILQVCTLAGIAGGLWLAIHYGEQVGSMLGITKSYAMVCGFAIVLVAAMIGVNLISRALRGLFSFAGLGILDVIAGVVVACAKYLLILCAIFSVFDILNANIGVISQNTLDSSLFYNKILGIGGKIMPYLRELSETIKQTIQ